MSKTLKIRPRLIVKVGDFVFWEYNLLLCPATYRGGVVTKVHKDGRVSVNGYGGYTFKPTLCMSKKKGKAMLAALDQAESERMTTLVKINIKFAAKLRAIVHAAEGERP